MMSDEAEERTLEEMIEEGTRRGYSDLSRMLLDLLQS